MSSEFISTEGKVLLASPYLEDPNFFQAVVYMIRHTQDDAFGLILNRPTEHPLAEVLEKVADIAFERHGWLYFGGPVDGPLVALHDQADLADLPCNQGIYLTSERDRLLPLMSRDDARIKLFAGFSGWGPGQLESEMSTGSWLSTEIDLDGVLGDSHGLWKALLHQVGHSVWSETGFDFGDPSRASWN